MNDSLKFAIVGEEAQEMLVLLQCWHGEIAALHLEQLPPHLETGKPASVNINPPP